MIAAPPPALLGFDRAEAATRHGRSVSLHALHVAEYALSAPAPRRERTWLHRLKIAVDVLADAVDRQIEIDDNSVGLLAEISLSEPDYLYVVIGVRDEQRALRVPIASLSERLEIGAEFAVDTTSNREQLDELAHWYRQHQTWEAELIHAALDIDVTELPHLPSGGAREKATGYGHRRWRRLTTPHRRWRVPG